MSRRGTLIDPRRQRAHFRDLIGHLLTHQVAPKTDLATLTDKKLAAVSKTQMMWIETVARLDALVEPAFRIAPLVGDHASFAGASRRARHCSPARQRDLCFVRKRAKRHAGDIDRNVEHHRALCERADDGFGFAFLAITLDDEAGQRS